MCVFICTYVYTQSSCIMLAYFLWSVCVHIVIATKDREQSLSDAGKRFTQWNGIGLAKLKCMPSILARVVENWNLTLGW